MNLATTEYPFNKTQHTECYIEALRAAIIKSVIYEASISEQVFHVSLLRK